MDQGGIRPNYNDIDPNHSGLGRLGAVGERESEEDFEDLVASGVLEEEGQARSQREISGGPAAEVPDHGEGEEGKDPKGRNAPVKPSPEEVAKHNLTHIPRRMWCKVCAEADIQEDPHRRSGADHKDDGEPEFTWTTKRFERASGHFSS